MKTEAKKAPLNDAFLSDVKRAIWLTWQAIGHDVEQCAEECGERVKNDGAVESCIDADRLLDYGGINGLIADTAITAAIRDHGYPKVLRFLSRNIRLA